MSTKGKASNTVQDVKGRLKEAAGRLTGNRDLKNKGRADEAKAGMKNAGESVKDAAHEVKDAVTE